MSLQSIVSLSHNKIMTALMYYNIDAYHKNKVSFPSSV